MCVFVCLRADMDSTTNIPGSAPAATEPHHAIQTNRQVTSIRLVDIPMDARSQYHFTVSGVLGAMHIATGLASIAIMAGCFAAKAEHYGVGHGIWCALPVSSPSTITVS